MISIVQEIFRDVFDNEELIITKETKSAELKDWDSVAHIDILIALENEFSLKFSIEEAYNIKSVKDILDLLEKKKLNKL